MNWKNKNNLNMFFKLSLLIIGFSFIFSIFHSNFNLKEAKDMAVIYATLIIKGKKTIFDVPSVIRDQVKEILIDMDLPELADDTIKK